MDTPMQSTPGAAGAEGGSQLRAPRIRTGTCYVLFAYDVGLEVDLDGARPRLASAQPAAPLPRRRRAPDYIGYQSPPLRVGRPSEPVKVGRYSTTAHAELVVFDFGAVGVQYSIPIAGPMEDLLELSCLLYENAALLSDSKRQVEGLVEEIRPWVVKARIASFVEDFQIYHIEEFEPGAGAVGASASGIGGEASAVRSSLAARILRAEPGKLSAEEERRTLECRISYGPDDVVVIDWNGAMVVGREMDDVIAVLEYTNVELLEMRYLDDRLDRALAAPAARPASLWRRGASGEASLRAVAEMQIDAARLFEEVNNAMKLLGDQYLARVYRLASQRLHLPEWDADILRKLETLESIYQKLNDYRTSRRLEVLEWIVIVLIAAEIVLSVLHG